MIIYKKTSMLIIFSLILGCSSVPKPKGLQEHLEDNGWIYADIPRELLGPGSIVSITPQDGITYRGKIEDCVEGVEIVSGAAALPSFQQSYTLKMSAALQYAQIVTLGPEISKVESVDLELGDVQDFALNEIGIVESIELNGVSAICALYLQGLGKVETERLKGSIWVINAALRVDSYKMTFKQENGIKIALNTNNLGKFVKFAPEVEYKVDGEGKIEVTSPTFIGFKTAILMNPTGGSGAAAPDTISLEVMLKRRFNLLNK